MKTAAVVAAEQKFLQRIERVARAETAMKQLQPRTRPRPGWRELRDEGRG